MCTMQLFALFLFFLHASGFLLDKSGSNNGQSGTSNQYVTSSVFFAESKARHQGDEQLRLYVDQSLSILTSQLEKKFDIVEQKLIKCENQSVQNKAYESLEQQFVDLERKYVDLESKYNQLQSVKNDFNLVKHQLVSVQNKTSELGTDVSILKQLGNIKPLQEIQTLQQAVQTVSAQTHSLSVNERARSQDFLALYNMTIGSKQELNELTTNTSSRLTNLETETRNQLSTLELRQNATAADISSRFQAVMALNTNTNNQLKKLETKTNKQFSRIEQSQNSTAADIITRMEAKETSDNLTMTMVQKQIENNAERVGMTAHPSTSMTITNTIMKFNDVTFSVGITNLASYKSTGKFTCEHEGLYLISASVMSFTSNAYYYMYLNGRVISNTYIGQHSGGDVHTGAVTITWKLNLNDQVWLYAPGTWYLYGGLPSKLTIIKIK